MLDRLKIYTDMGWALFPCAPKTKAPLTSHGFKDATCSLKQIEECHNAYPNCAWGVATSAERGVIDIDPRNGGDKSLAALEAEHGPMPITPKVKTGGGGFHYWLKFPAGTKCGKVADGIDRKADGGYVIVPPSKIAIPEHEGRAYAWEVKPWDGVPLAEAPAWALGLTPKPTASAEPDAENPWVVRPSVDDLLSHPGSPEGERRKTLCQLVGVQLARGDSTASVYALAEAWAARCTPALDEWRKHVDGLARKEEAKAGRMTTPSSALPNGDGVLPEAGREQTNSPAEAQAELVPSLPPSAHSEQGGVAGLSTDWPTLPPDAYHGLLGEMLRAVSPETEADPAGVILGWLTCFGSIVGRGAWMSVGPRLHHPALYVGIVGRTSDAKGDGWAVALWPFKQVEPAWAATCIANGVGSGEGLIERVADEQVALGKDGKAEVIPGASDKRCLLRLSELSRCFKVGRRENATLSEYLREAWDGDPINIPNRKGNALSTSGYAISMMGDVTPGVIRKLLESGTEAFDGNANRYLWAAVRSPRSLPMGGDMAVLTPFLDRLASALAFAKQAGEVKRDVEALWREAYPSLKASGDSVPHTERARPYALRLAVLYALADVSRLIRREHLQAALALWSYCRASARLIFCGQQTPAQPDPLWLRLLNAINDSPGVSRTGLREVAGHKVVAQEIENALGTLEARGWAFRRMAQPKGGGHPAECWYPGPKPDGDGDGESVKPQHSQDVAAPKGGGPSSALHSHGEGESMMNDNPSPLASGQPVSASAETSGREGTNSPAEADAEAEAKLVPSPQDRGANSEADAAAHAGSMGREGTNSPVQPEGSLLPGIVGREQTPPAGEHGELVPSLPGAGESGEPMPMPMGVGVSGVVIPDLLSPEDVAFLRELEAVDANEPTDSMAWLREAGFPCVAT